MKIFWSWQSDTHQPTGRYFVREVLRSVAEELNGSDDMEEADRPDDLDDGDHAADGRIELDHDTLGIGGSPKIADKILEKIEAAAVFVADLTPVCKTKAGKVVPNPNVMIELGYALKVLGNERIVLVMNQAEGATSSKLPFDLRHWRQPVAYKLHRDASEEQIAEAAAKLKRDLTPVIAPSLLLAAKAIRANKIVVPKPNLVVEWAAGNGTVIVVPREPNLGNVPTLLEVKEQTPLLDPEPSPYILNVGTPGSKTFSVPNMQAIENWSRGKRLAHNIRTQAYYKDYERYLNDVTDYARLVLRSVTVDLVLRNVGTAMATNIDVEIQFPEFVMFHDDEGQFPAPPRAPSPPSALYPLVDLGSDEIGMPYRLSAALSAGSMTIDPKARFVSFHYANLKHHREQRLEKFHFSFVKPNAVKAFDASYVITVAEPIEPFRGTIRFDFES